MAIVCTHRKNKQSSLRSALVESLGLCLVVPGLSLAAPPPTDAECDGAVTFSTEVQQLNFGRMIPNGGGTVTVDYQGARSTTGPILLTSTVLPGILVFTTPGFDCSNKTPTVTFTNGTLSRIGGGTTPMTLNNLTYSTKPGNPFTKFNTGYYYIGGDLVVPAAPESGGYAGTYGITITFP